jgi:hypothetical protein
MTRPAIHFLVDVLLFVAFVCLLWSSALLQFVFPPATQADGWTLWGVAYDTWSTARFVSLAAFTVCTLVHLILQWNWVCSFINTRMFHSRNKLSDGVKTAYGVSTLIGVLTVIGMSLFIAAIAIRKP